MANWIDLDGLVNLRDVGDLPTADGGRIARGRLLRSDNLQRIP
ncbi:MAG: tyrosine-protein phosphatase, partial [Microlunatus sp.]|nr:tyrosine-protein phosphatase [Microlunatus sp.]